ncbi:acyltransferase, partial [Bacillus sp. VKPM B-3276]
KKMKPVRVYFVCSFLRGLYCLKVCSFQLMENRRVSILKLMGMCVPP